MGFFQNSACSHSHEVFNLADAAGATQGLRHSSFPAFLSKRRRFRSCKAAKGWASSEWNADVTSPALRRNWQLAQVSSSIFLLVFAMVGAASCCLHFCKVMACFGSPVLFWRQHPTHSHDPTSSSWTASLDAESVGIQHRPRSLFPMLCVFGYVVALTSTNSKWLHHRAEPLTCPHWRFALSP